MLFVPRFSIRTLLLLILLVAGAAFWLSREIAWEQRKTEALARLREDYERVKGRMMLDIIPKANAEQTLAQRILGDRASPPIEKLVLNMNGLHEGDRFILERYAKEQPWFDFQYVPELEELSVHVQRNTFLIPTANVLSNLRSLNFEFCGTLNNQARDLAILEEYLAVLPNLPHLKTFWSRYDHARPLMTGKQLVRLLDKAPNLTELYAQLVDFDDQTIAALQKPRKLEHVSLNFWEPDESRYIKLVTTLLKQPQLTHLLINNEVEKGHSNRNPSDPELAFIRRLLAKNQEVVVEHDKLEMLYLTHAARIRCQNCPRLGTAEVSMLMTRAECSDCPAAYNLPLNAKTSYVTRCPKLSDAGRFEGDCLELDDIKQVRKLNLPHLECLKTHGSIAVQELVIFSRDSEMPPERSNSSVSLTGLKEVEIECLTPAMLKLLTQQKQAFNLTINAVSSLSIAAAGWTPEHCTKLFAQAPLGDLRIDAASPEMFQSLIPALSKSSTVTRMKIEHLEHFLEVLFLSPENAGVKSDDFSDAALERRCRYSLPKQLQQVRFWIGGQNIANGPPDEEEYKVRIMPLLHYLKRKYPQIKTELAGPLAFRFEDPTDCLEIELVPAPAAPAD